jgi:hypothetical protein
VQLQVHVIMSAHFVIHSAETQHMHMSAAGKGFHKKQSPPYDDEGADDHSDVEDAEDYRKGAGRGCRRRRRRSSSSL